MTSFNSTAAHTAGSRSESGTFEFSDWLTPDGHDCPVDKRMLVEIERREGSFERGPAGHWASPYRHQSSWWHNGGNCDIVRYRKVYFVDAAAKGGA